MIDPAVINTFIGFAFPLSLLLYVRRYGSSAHYIALACFALFMATAGLGKLLPFFGHSVVGGSFYFPTALYAMTMLGYYTGSMLHARQVAQALMVGAFFLLGGSLRWVVFSIYGGELTTHAYSADYGLLYASIVMLFKAYLATTLGILMAQWQFKNEGFLVVPVGIEVIVTTPLVLYGAQHTHPGGDYGWNDIVLWTYICRLLFTVFVAAGLCLSHKLRMPVAIKGEGCDKCLL